MSETKQDAWVIPEETVDKLAFLSKEFTKLNTGSTGDEFWLIVEDDNEGDYEGAGIAVGINKAGELVQAESSHCSCNSSFDEGFESFGNQALSGDLTVKFDIYYSFDDWLPELISTTDILYKALTGSEVNAKEIISLPNAEIRRAVVELVGYEKMIEDAEVVDESGDGTLLRIPLQGDEDIVLVHVKDPSTTREYFLRVPPTMKTAKQARAWTFGFDAEDFNLEVES